jgi:hypothetical protein
MKNLIIIVALFFATIPVAISQTIQYGGIQQFGLIFHEKGYNTSFNLVNGIRFHRFFAGVGIDAQFNPRNTSDYYYITNYYRSTPNNTSAVYLDARYYMNKKKNFFMVANVGVNYINQKMVNTDRETFEKKTGYYSAFGFGFKAKLGGDVFYSFDVSYGLRQTKYNYNYINFIDEWQTEKNDIRKRYIVVKMGFEIF